MRTKNVAKTTKRKDSKRSFDSRKTPEKVQAKMGTKPLDRWPKDAQELSARLSQLVAERKQIEKSLRQSEAKFRILFDNTYDMEFWINPEGHYLFVSPSCKRITGHDPSEFMENPRLRRNLVHPEDLPIFDSHVQEEGKEMTSQEVQFRIIRSDGSLRWIGHVCQRIFDEKGRFLGIRGSNRDITQRKQAEEGLATSRNLLQNIIDNTPDFVYVFDLEERFLIANRAVAQLLNSSPERMIGKKRNEFMPEDTAAWHEANDRKVIETGSALEFEEYGEFKGRAITFLTNKFPLRDPRGMINAVAGISTDMTERKQMEEVLRKSKERFEILSETAGKLLASDKPQEMVNELCRKVMTHLDCHAFFNYLADEGRGRLHLNAYTGISEESGKQIEWLDYGVAVCGCAAQDGCRIVAENIPNTPDPRTELVKSFGIKAYACHPLLSAGRVIGTLSFGTRSRTTFTEEELSLMKTVADQVAVAMERIQLMESMRKSRDELDIRVRERTREVKEQSRILDSFFKFSITPFVILDRDFNFIRVNEAYAKACHREVAEFPGHNHFEFYPSNAKAKFEQVVQTKKPYVAFARPFRFPDHPEWGLTYWDWTLTPILDDAGDVGSLVFSLEDVTARRRAQEAIRAERQRFNDVLEMLPAYLVLLAPDHHVPFANRFFRERFGESHGKRCFEYLFGRNEPCEICETYTVLKTNAPHRWEWTGPDGRNYDVSDFPFTDSDGSTLVLEMGIDITERKKAEEAVRIASSYTRSLIEASLDPLVTISADGKIMDVNSATELTTGVPRDELIGTDFSDYFTEPEKAREGYQRVFREGSVRDYPLAIRHTLGNQIDVLYHATVYKNETGEVQGVFAAARDVTELKRTQDALRAASLYTRSLIEASLDPLVTISADGKIMDVNSATELTTGVPRDELIGTDFSDYFTEPEKAREGYQRVFREGSVRDYPLAIRHTSGKVTDVLYHATVFRDEAGVIQGVFAAARDITARKRGEAALRESENRLRLLSSQLINVQEGERKRIAREIHDSIGQTLAAIKFALESKLGQMSGGAAPPGVSIENIISLTQSGIEESRRIQMDLRPSILDDLGILATIGWFTREFQKVYVHISVEKHISVEEDEIPDSLRTVLFRVMQEAMNNVAKHSKADLIRLSLRKIEDRTELSIEDNGEGFDPEKIKQGLGLTSMRERTELSGGAFEIQSTVGKGTIIRASWPI